MAALGDVAKHFGHVVHGTTIADQAGLSGTVLGVGPGRPAPGLARRPAPGRAGRPLRAPHACSGARAALGPGVHRPGRGQPGVLVVRRHLRPGPAAAERHQRPGPGERGRGDRRRATGPRPSPSSPPGTAWAPGLTAVIHGFDQVTRSGFRGLFLLAVVPAGGRSSSSGTSAGGARPLLRGGGRAQCIPCPSSGRWAASTAGACSSWPPSPSPWPSSPARPTASSSSTPRTCSRCRATRPRPW